ARAGPAAAVGCARDGFVQPERAPPERLVAEGIVAETPLAAAHELRGVSPQVAVELVALLLPRRGRRAIPRLPSPCRPRADERDRERGHGARIEGAPEQDSLREPTGAACRAHLRHLPPPLGSFGGVF